MSAQNGAQSRRAYTEADDRFIAEHYGGWSNRQIADVLSRSESGIRYRARKLGLERASYEPPKAASVPKSASDRHARLCALRDLMEADILGGEVPPMQKPSYFREYRAVLAEIDELEGTYDDAEDAEPQDGFAAALAALADQQRRLLEQAAGS